MTIKPNKFKLISHKMELKVQMNHSWVKQWGGNLLLALLAAVLGLGMEAALASPNTAAAQEKAARRYIQISCRSFEDGALLGRLLAQYRFWTVSDR